MCSRRSELVQPDKKTVVLREKGAHRKGGCRPGGGGGGAAAPRL